MRSASNIEFERLFKDHFKELSVFAMKYLYDLEESKSLVHEVFIALWERFDSMDHDTNFRSYLYSSVRNRCLNVIRDRKNTVALEEVDQETQQTSDALEVEELSNEINFAINSLPEKCREVFLLSRKEELKYAEIAAELKISVKTVEAQMSKALKLMRQHLAEFLAVLIFIIME